MTLSERVVPPKLYNVESNNHHNFYEYLLGAEKFNLYL